MGELSRSELLFPLGFDLLDDLADGFERSMAPVGEANAFGAVVVTVCFAGQVPELLELPERVVELVDLQRRRIAGERASAPLEYFVSDLFSAQVRGIDRVHPPAISQVREALPAHLFPTLVRDDVRHVRRIARLSTHPLSERR